MKWSVVLLSIPISFIIALIFRGELVFSRTETLWSEGYTANIVEDYIPYRQELKEIKDLLANVRELEE